jgi:hypothetical protein
VEVVSLSPPFVTDGRVLKRSLSKKVIATREFMLKLSEFETNFIGRMSKLKVYQGELGNWRDETLFGQTLSMRSHIEYCDVASSAIYWKINLTDPTKMTFSSVNECEFCRISYQNRPPSYSDF